MAYDPRELLRRLDSIQNMLYIALGSQYHRGHMLAQADKDLAQTIEQIAEGQALGTDATVTLLRNRLAETMRYRATVQMKMNGE